MRCWIPRAGWPRRPAPRPGWCRWMRRADWTEQALAEAVDDTTALVSVMWANNEVGTRQPVELAAAAGHPARRAVP